MKYVVDDVLVVEVDDVDDVLVLNEDKRVHSIGEKKSKIHHLRRGGSACRS